jgi:hypothetical protein
VNRKTLYGGTVGFQPMTQRDDLIDLCDSRGMPAHDAAESIKVYRSYRIMRRMKITSWYKNGSLDAFRQLCAQIKDRAISIMLINRSEPVRGALHSYCLDSSNAAGLFLLLTDIAVHPAYYGLMCIESLHIGFDEAWLPRTASSEDGLSSEIIVSRRSALRHIRQQQGN